MSTASVRDIAEHMAANATHDLPATQGMYAWYADGGIITPKAFAAVTEIMRNDMLGKGRASGAGRFRPSNLGKCPRMQVISYHGLGRDFHIDPDGEHLMGGGTWGHYRWQLSGLSLPFLTAAEIKVVDKALGIRGSGDGVLTDGTGFELKTVNARRLAEVRKNRRPFPDHEMQIAGYGKATGIPVWSVVYEHRDSGEFLEYRVDVTNDLLLSLQMEVGSLVKHVKDKTLPVMRDDCIDKKGFVYDHCPYRITCPLLGDTYSG